MFWCKKKKISDIVPSLPFSEIRKRVRILVIDDDEKAFPYELLNKEGYNVHYWANVQNLRDLEGGEYDIIVLDIYGVTSKALSSTDGLGVLEHIKKYNPAQLVIAYSGQTYDFSKAGFWSLADDYLGKPSSLIDCKEKIDALLKKSFTPAHYWNGVIKTLKDAGVSDKKIIALENEYVKCMQKGQTLYPEHFELILAIGKQAIGTVVVLLKIIDHLCKTS